MASSITIIRTAEPHPRNGPATRTEKWLSCAFQRSRYCPVVVTLNLRKNQQILGAYTPPVKSPIFRQSVTDQVLQGQNGSFTCAERYTGTTPLLTLTVSYAFVAKKQNDQRGFLKLWILSLQCEKGSPEAWGRPFVKEDYDYDAFDLYHANDLIQIRLIP